MAATITIGRFLEQSLIFVEFQFVVFDPLIPIRPPRSFSDFGMSGYRLSEEWQVDSRPERTCMSRAGIDVSLCP